MKYTKDNNRKKEPINKSFIGIGIILLFFTLIIIATTTELSGVGNKKKSGRKEKPKNDISEELETIEGIDLTGVLIEIDEVTANIVVMDMQSGEKKLLYYDGGSNVRNKFDQVITMLQIEIGSIVDINYKEKNITSLKQSSKSWEYKKVNNLSIDQSKKIMRISSNPFKYTDNLIILNADGMFLDIDDVNEKSEFTLRGDGETIYSMIVTKGHGRLRLSNDDDFIGGMISIGYENPTKISKDMVLTVREGSFNLTVENNAYSATKHVKITRDEEVIVSLAGLGPEAEKLGLVDFKIEPEGADLYIGGKLVDYRRPVELTYGNHDIEISYIGYMSYKGKVEVAESGKIIRARLPEISSEEKVDIEVENSTEDDTPKGDTSKNNPKKNNTSTQQGDISDEVMEKLLKNKDYTIDKDHYIYIQKPIGASVYLNGEFIMTSPGRLPKVLGKHILTFIEKDFSTKSYPVEIEDNGLDKYFNLSE